MRIETLIHIYNMLENEQEEALNTKKYFQEAMKDKYNTQWYENELNDDEKKIIQAQRTRISLATAAYDDFVKHDWN